MPETPQNTEQKDDESTLKGWVLIVVILVTFAAIGFVSYHNGKRAAL